MDFPQFARVDTMNRLPDLRFPHPLLPADREHYVVLKHSAATMPVGLARYESTVTECRPIMPADLDTCKCILLGHGGITSNCTRRNYQFDWQTNYPDYPFTKSWAWWIGIENPKGEPE